MKNATPTTCILTFPHKSEINFNSQETQLRPTLRTAAYNLTKKKWQPRIFEVYWITPRPLY